MKMKIKFDLLLLLSIALLICSLVSADGTIGTGILCPFYSNNTEYFPQYAKEATLTSCSQFSPSACCEPIYDALISGSKDYVGKTFDKYLKPTSSCKQVIRGAQCLLCSSAQSAFFSLHNYGNSIKLCQSFCDDLYENCKSSKLVNDKSRTVEQEFASSSNPGDDFCYAVFHPQWNIEVSTNNCEMERPCTEEDYVGVYTPCHEGVRSAVYYLKENVKCTGGVPLPASKTDLPCDIYCGAGKALLIGDTECTSCAPGSYSLGGGDTYEDWDSKPRDFITFCTQFDESIKEVTLVEGCGWQWNDTITATGYHWNDLNLNVTLEVGAAFIRSHGFVSFEAKVSASNGHNQLLFLVGEQLIFSTSRTAGYEIFGFEMSPGHHILKWIYTKDNSGSVGEDQASIRWIQLIGTKLADDECTLCEPGMYQHNKESAGCYYCPYGTYSSVYGATDCTPCPSDTYSWEGATECIERLPCTEYDIVSTYNVCGVSGQRYLVYNYTNPLICDKSTIDLPPSELVDCAPCPEGYHRRDSECVGCQTGLFWDGTQCVECPAGSAAPAYKIYQTFDNGWTHTFGTSCSGSGCATEGWQLNGTTLTSGRRQGPQVVSDLFLIEPVALKAGDVVTADLTVYCTQELSGNLQVYPCALTFLVIYSGSIIPTAYEITNSSRKAVTQYTYTWNATIDGEYQVLFSFQKSSAIDTRNDDRASLNRLVIQTDQGSASTCEYCPAGTSTNGKNKQTRCTDCPPGYFSVAGSAECQPCEEGTFSATSRSPVCKPCGFGTSSNANKTGCIDHCYVAFGDVEYDLSKLKRDEMYGPIYDKNHERYFIDVCKIPETTYSCVDGQGRPVHAYVCQITNNINPVGLNLGTFVSYSENERGDIRSGLTVNYTGGSGGCRGQYRSTTIHFTCDPEAGVGTPEPFEPVENPLCHYSFLWPSTYACPLCTSRDYTSDQSDCIDGQATQVFRWLYPKRCHDGAPLPDPVVTPCSTEITVCGGGYYWDAVESKCVICPAGHYCEDGGLLYDDWTTSSGFNATGHWDTAASYLFSQGGTLSKTMNFQRAGTVTTVYNAYLNDGKLSLTVDSTEHLLPAGSTDFETIRYEVPVSLGTHQLTWTLTPGTSLLDHGYGLFIHNITVRGLFYSLTRPVPCPAGTSSEEGQSNCSPCPADYTSVSTGPCTRCQENFYSRAGDPQCNPVPTCTEADWQMMYTDCTKGSRQAVYIKINMCRSDAPGVNKLNVTRALACASCPAGFLRKDELGNTTDDCRPCQTGFYVQNDKCVQIPKGSVAPLERVLWQNSSSITLPDGFTTGCAGLSCVSNGWRIRDTFIESGSQDAGFADSWLRYDVAMISDGSITFHYNTEDDGEHSGLQFYIDDVLQDSIIYGNSGSRSSGVIPLMKGKHRLLWNYHHQNEKAVQTMASLRDIRIRGDSRGGASAIEQCQKGFYADKQLQCAPCPPGSYSDSAGKTSCSLCSKGTFSDEPGASQCKKCPKGTYSDSNGATFCSSSCTFNAGGRTYDLAPLNQAQTVLASGRFLLLRLCDRLPKNLSEPAGEKTDSFIIDLQSQQSLGKYLSQSDVPPGANLQLTFTAPADGDCTEYTTDIAFYCEMPNETNTVYGMQSGPVLIRTSKCNSKFAWKSFFACPLCRNYELYDDYTQQTTECDKNTQNVSYVRTTACFGPAIVGVHTEPCSNKVAFPIYVLISLAVVFIALAIAAVIFYINYRSLNSRYSLLVEEKNKNLEMNEIASNSSTQSAEENAA